MRNNSMIITRRSKKKIVFESEFESTFILSRVQSCTPMDLEFSNFHTHNISSFQNLKRGICKIHCKPMQSVMKIQKSAECVLPSGLS